MDMALFEGLTHAFETLATFVFGMGFAMMFPTSRLSCMGQGALVTA